jgi:hypothetical protein
MGSNLTKTAASGGIQDTQEGLDFQWKNLILFASRCFALQSQVQLFGLLTEIQEAEKFDDVVLEYVNKHNEVKYILAQAKHKKNSKEMDSNSLIVEDNFSLVKYFASFWKISQKFGAQEIENVMIITNNTLVGSKKSIKVGQILTMQIQQSSESLYLEKTDHFIFGSIGEIFKFVSDQHSNERDKLFEIVRIIILSYELVNLYIKKPKTDFLSQNQKILFDTIIDRNSLTIKKDFLNGTFMGFEFFSMVFDRALKAAGDKNLPIENKIVKIQAHFQNIFKKNIAKSTLTAKQKNADDTINDFLNKFLYVTKVKIEDLQIEIDSELCKTFNRRNVELVSASVEVCLKSWFMDRKNTELTRHHFEDFISKSQTEIASMKMIVLKKESFRDSLEFSSIPPQVGSFINHLDPNQPRILRLETPESETHFAAMRILAKHSAKEEDALMFLTTNFTGDNFKQGLEVFEKLSCYKLLVVELHKNTFQVFERHEDDFDIILQNDPAKKVVVIGDASLVVNLQNMQTVEENESYFTDLVIDSQNQILDENIRFQDQETTWRAVLDGHDMSTLRIPLREILNNQLGNEINVSNVYSEKIYISRTILYNSCLKPSILQRNNQQSNDVFLIDDVDEFEKQRQSQVPHHLLQRSSNQLEWIESTKDLSVILEHIDESNPKTSSEFELTKSSSHVTIVSDVAGMGKSSLFSKSAQALKVFRSNQWIYKFDLNDHSDALDELTEIKLNCSEDAVNFIADKIMKLKSDFEKKHFTRSCTETGKVILLIDGVDEIFNSYGEEVVQLMKLLSQTKIKKIFISTRPECCERLEKEFLQIKHSLQPFSEADQKKYFLEFLKNNEKFKDLTETELNEIVDAFMESMKRSIRAKDYKHTGVPLVTKLVAEFLEGKIFQVNKATLDKTVKSLKSEKFNLWILYESFRTKSFDIYFREKRGMDVKKSINRRVCNEEKRKIMENYKIFAIQQFLKKDAAKFFPDVVKKKFTDFEIEEMEKVGLIYKTDDGYKFVHQTFAENLFTLFLMENFEQPKVAEFIVHLVLVEDQYRVVRSFIEYWIEDKVSSDNFDIYFEPFFPESPAQNTTPIHVSSKEQNPKILDFIYNCLTKSSKFKNQKSKVEQYFFTCDKDKVPAIFDLIRWSGNLNQFFDSVKNDFGSEFVRDIFRYKIQIGNNDNLLFYISQFGENLPVLLRWIRLKFDDPEFLKQQIFSIVEIDKCGILHYAFQFFPNQILANLLDELQNWEQVLGIELFQKLILMEDKNNKSFLFYYVYNDGSDTDFLIKILNAIKIAFENDESFLTKIIFHGDQWNQIFLNRFCVFSKKFDLLKILKWFHGSFGFDHLENLLLNMDNNQGTIIFQFFTNDRNSIASGLDILNYLKNDLYVDENFLKTKIILQKTYSNEDILLQFFLRSESLDQFNHFIENQFKISDSELRSSLTESNTILFHFAQKSKEDQEQYLSFMESKFGSNILNELITSGTLCEISCQSGRFDDFGSSILKFFEFVEQKFVDIDFLKTLISYKGGHNQTFIFHLFEVANKCLMKILNYFLQKFKNEKTFLGDFLLSIDDYGNTFTRFYLIQKDAPKMMKISKEFFELIKINFGSDFLKRLLLIKSKRDKNFHHGIVLNIHGVGGVEKSLEVLENLLEVVGKDRDFFVELTKQDDGVPDQIKEFLDGNFKETKKVLPYSTS